MDKADWLAWAGVVPEEMPSLPPQAPLSPLLRRRVTPIGRLAFQTACALPALDRARFIFASRHGEYRRTLALLRSLAAEEPLSPADFSLSVHNALAGLLSIDRRNHGGHTAVAAGADSFGFGLLEAAACLAERPAEPVVMVYYDEPLPDEYGSLCDERESLVVALLLSRGNGAGRDILLSPARPGKLASGRPATAQALDFMHFLLSGDDDRVLGGDRFWWRCRRAVA